MHTADQYVRTQHHTFEQATDLTSGATSKAILDGDAAACGLSNRKLPRLHLAVCTAREVIAIAAQPRLRKMT